MSADENDENDVNEQLFRAVCSSNSEGVRVALAAGADPCFDMGDAGRCSLYYSIIRHAIPDPTVFILLDSLEGQINRSLNHDGSTALHVACESTKYTRNHAVVALVDKLLLMGADFSVRNNNGVAPLTLALSWGKSETIIMLCKLALDAGYKMCANDFLAAVGNSSVSVVEFLIEQAADDGLEIVDFNGVRFPSLLVAKLTIKSCLRRNSNASFIVSNEYFMRLCIKFSDKLNGDECDEWIDWLLTNGVYPHSFSDLSWPNGYDERKDATRVNLWANGKHPAQVARRELVNVVSPPVPLEIAEIIGDYVAVHPIHHNRGAFV